MKIDMHVHSSDFSPCGEISVAELIPLYRKAGFDGFALTDHFFRGGAEIQKKAGHPDFGKAYLDHFRRAEELGRRSGFRIFLGFEMQFDESPDHFLVYGMPEDLFAQWDALLAMGLKNFSALARERGFPVYQSHPFRDGIRIVDPAYLFGMEVVNGHSMFDNRNDIARAWAEKYNLHGIAGSDCHELCDLGSAGIETDETLRDTADLLRVLKTSSYRIFQA